MREDKRVTLKCDSCYGSQRGTMSELLHAGWVKVGYRITVAVGQEQGYCTERCHSTACPRCARGAVTEATDAIEERYLKSPSGIKWVNEVRG